MRRACSPAALGVKVGGGDAVQMRDAHALRAYRGRLRELREQLEEAGANADLGRMTAAREEIEYLSSHLAAACGFRGRQHPAGAVTERARVSVRNAIAHTLSRIGRHDSVLWRHLANSIRTGTFCSYEPERPVRWRF